MTTPNQGKIDSQTSKSNDIKCFKCFDMDNVAKQCLMEE